MTIDATPPPPPPPPPSQPDGDLTDNDKLMALLSWILAPLVGIIVLVTEGKNRSFQKYHAVNSIAASVALYVIAILAGCICTTVTFGFGGIIAWAFPFIVWIPLVIWGIQSYQGKWVDVPVITNFVKGQNWI